jgi:hypothetical protein
LAQTATASAVDGQLYNDSSYTVTQVFIGSFDGDINNADTSPDMDWLHTSKLPSDYHIALHGLKRCVRDVVIFDDQGDSAIIDQADLCSGYHITDDDWGDY